MSRISTGNPATDFTPENIVSWIGRCLPNPEHVTWIDICNSYVSFFWRGNTYRVSVDSIFTEKVEGVISIRSDDAVLIEALIKKQWLLEKGQLKYGSLA